MEDWQKFPSAIIDTQTKNKSFLRLAQVYKSMGIKNHAFILALVNPRLQGVDPFSTELTHQQMVEIAIECKVNPWYFFRECARVPVKGSDEPVFLEANRGNIALYWLFFNHIQMFLIQVRQTGKSVSTNVLHVLLMNILCRNTLINLLTKDDKLREENIKSIKDIDAELPFYLRQRTKDDLNNTEQITVKKLKNSLRGHVPQKSPKDALNQGRGFTSPIFHIDEGPFQANIGVSLPAALAGGTAARDQARKNNTPYGTILTTTAGKKDDRDGKYMYSLLINSADWTEKFLDCQNIEELENVIRRSSPNGHLRVNCTFNHRQLGKDDQWLYRAVEESNATGEDADRDFGNKWTAGSQSSPLSVQILEKIKNSEIEPRYIEISKPHGYITKWFIQEHEIQQYMKSSQFVMALDTSEASGGDDISLTLMNIKTGEVVACGSFNETNLITFAQWLCDWFVKYDTFTAIIERRSTGSAVLDYLLLMLPSFGIDPFQRLFNRVVNDSDEYPERYKEISQSQSRKRMDVINAHKKHFGFATSGSGITSRSDLYSVTLQNAAKKIGEKVRDKKTIDQIAGLITKNGRVDHPAGEHDDLVISWALCFWLLSQGKNLSFYGIDSKLIFSEVRVVEYTDRASYQQSVEQQQIRQQIEQTYERLSNERDTYVIMKLEHTLRALDRKLILREDEKFSVDDLINSLREEKRKSARQTSSSHYDPNRLVTTGGYYTSSYK